MDAWWDRKGENEIDLVGEDSVGNKLDFYEIKRDAKRLNLAELELKTKAFFEKHPSFRDRKAAIKGLSVDDM